MSLNNIKSKYRNKANSICRNRWAWGKNPERCRAAKIYSKKADQFVKNVLKDSHKDTKNHMKLLEQRIKSKEHKNLYPINNHDFDYKTAMKKEFNVFKRGITNDPTLQNLSIVLIASFNLILTTSSDKFLEYVTKPFLTFGISFSIYSLRELVPETLLIYSLNKFF